MNTNHYNTSINLEEKTRVYLDDFKPNDTFWGFGIENECYLEFINKKTKKLYKDVLANTKRERYSVDYNTSYNLEMRQKEVYDFKINNETIELPMLLNAYAFQAVDINNQHRTTYEKMPKPNKKFTGKSIYEVLKDKDKFFLDEHGPGKGFVFDGDTIEFTTRNFYKNSIQNIIQELKDKNANFIEKFNNNVDFNFRVDNVKFNYGFVNFYSNPNNTGLFNNGTYHFNITLPTKLNKNTELFHEKDFLNIHCNVGKIIQWFSPLFVACYGSSDIYSLFSKKYAFGSQRICASRYISIGTFNFDTPIFGKYLQDDRLQVLQKLPEYFWLRKVEEKSGYLFTEKIGMDFNMLKHKNLGIEWRIMDMFPYEYLEDFTMTLLLIIDYCIRFNISNPIYSKTWNKLVYGCIMKGWTFCPNNNIILRFDKEFDLNITNIWHDQKQKTIYNFFNLVIDEIYFKMEKSGFGILYNSMNEVKRKPYIYNWNKIKWETEIDYYFKNYENKYMSNIKKEIKINNILETRTLFYLESKGKIKIKKYNKKKIKLKLL
jgi:hypothetical protein